MYDYELGIYVMLLIFIFNYYLSFKILDELYLPTMHNIVCYGVIIEPPFVQTTYE